MPPKGYKSVTISENLLNRIESFINENPELGIRSVTEFVVESIRKRIEDLEEIKMKKNEVEMYQALSEKAKKYKNDSSFNK
ncbi:MAG: hypothetical protein ACP5RS_04775 [Thermoplasmata archaeon]